MVKPWPPGFSSDTCCVWRCWFADIVSWRISIADLGIVGMCSWGHGHKTNRWNMINLPKITISSYHIFVLTGPNHEHYSHWNLFVAGVAQPSPWAPGGRGNSPATENAIEKAQKGSDVRWSPVAKLDVGYVHVLCTYILRLLYNYTTTITIMAQVPRNWFRQRKKGFNH